MAAEPRWEDAQTGTAGDETRNVNGGYWAVVGPHEVDGGFGWTVVRNLTGDDVADGKAPDSPAAKAAVAKWEREHDLLIAAPQSWPAMGYVYDELGYLTGSTLVADEQAWQVLSDAEWDKGHELRNQ